LRGSLSHHLPSFLIFGNPWIILFYTKPVYFSSRAWFLSRLGKRTIRKDLSLEFIAPGSYIQLTPARDYKPDPDTSAGSHDENQKEQKLNKRPLPERIGRKSFKKITVA
jgi:hypothetical protein